METTRTIALDPLSRNFHPAISWRSILAGLLVALFSFITLTALGFAVGGVSLSDGATLQNAGFYGGLWVLGSVVLSLAIASYVSSRVSLQASPRAGMVQGAVVCALFFAVLMWQATALVGWVAGAAGSTLSGLAQGAAAIAPAAQNAMNGQSAMLNELIEDNLQTQQGIQFKAEPSVVMAGFTNRLLRGNTDGAKAYLARNTNLSTTEIDARIGAINAQLTAAAEEARIKAADALRVSGWSIFALMIAGLLSAVLGGGLGSRLNLTSSLENEIVVTRSNRPAYA